MLLRIRRAPRGLHLMVGGLLALAIVDAGTTWVGLRQGHSEANGLVKSLMDALTVEGALAFRVAATIAFGALVLWLAGSYRSPIVRRPIYMVTIGMAAVWTFFVSSNVRMVA